MSATVEPWRGVDCGWLAVDRDGHVALFFTGGEGPIHGDAGPFDAAADDALRQMPAFSPFELLALARPQEVDVANRGLFAYEWKDTEGYELVARPDRPIHWTELPEPARTAAAAARMQAAFGVPVLSKFAVID
jgi:hypothetical protein